MGIGAVSERTVITAARGIGHAPRHAGAAQSFWLTLLRTADRAAKARTDNRKVLSLD